MSIMGNTNRQRAKQYKQRGFTLIEVLVAVVVLSIGLLGLAFLQIVSIKNNHSAQYRTEVTIEAYSIADRMRSNREDALLGGYDVVFGGSASGNTFSIADVATWHTALADAFTNGDGSIATDLITGVVTITVQWDDSRGTDGSTTEQLVVSVQI